MRLLFGRGGYHLTVDDDMRGMSGGFQGVTIEEGEGDFLRKSVGGGEGGFEVDHAGFGNVFFVAGLDGEWDAFFVELGGGDVLMKVGVDEERSLFVQNLDEGLQLDVAGRGVFLGISFGALH